MHDFLIFVDQLKQRFPIHVEITYSKMTDWTIYIYKKGVAEDYPKASHSGNDVVIVSEYDCDMEFCFAKAHVALKKWLLEFNGGY